MAATLCFCSDVDDLFEEFGIAYDPRKWRLFIDSSSRSLKCVLFHNGNQYPSIPIGHSVQMKGDYKNVKFLLKSISYARYNWQLWRFQNDWVFERITGRLYKTLLFSLFMGLPSCD